MVMDNEAKRIAEGLNNLEREWITGWQGPAGAAFNCIGEDLSELGLTISATNWNLSEKGLRVRTYLEQKQ